MFNLCSVAYPCLILCGVLGNWLFSMWRWRNLTLEAWIMYRPRKGDGSDRMWRFWVMIKKDSLSWWYSKVLPDQWAIVPELMEREWVTIWNIDQQSLASPRLCLRLPVCVWATPLYPLSLYGRQNERGLLPEWNEWLSEREGHAGDTNSGESEGTETEGINDQSPV